MHEEWWMIRRGALVRMLRSVRRLLVIVSVVPSSLILVTLMKEALRSSATSVLTRATRRNIPEDAILHSHCRENLKSYEMHEEWWMIRRGALVRMLRSVRRLLVTASVVPSSLILVTLMKEVLRSSATVGSYKSHTA
jgi:predicted hotdog family 3-hydroxylacyl-ACP dehydratase